MSRINVGINPIYLSDQHLIAESVEITMIPGSLKYNGYAIKGKVPEQFTLGTGHVNFFKDKLVYLALRLDEVNAEMKRRGFEPGTNIRLIEYPADFLWSWNPQPNDSDIVRQRIVDRLLAPKKANNSFHRYMGRPITDMSSFCDRLLQSKLFWL